VGGSYWTTFFPAVLVLGLGMAVSVAPLTTTVMNSVPESRAGVASGINNAVSRTAGLLAIAVLGIVMLKSFDRQLDQRLNHLALPTATREALAAQRDKLAGAELPQDVNPATGRAVTRAIQESFVGGFRNVMGVGVLLAIGSAISGWLLIRSPNEPSRRDGKG
jgi:hypothetical protein